MPIQPEVILRKYEKIIKDNLSNYFPEVSAGECIVKGEPLGGQFANTFRYKVTSDGVDITLYLKICPVFPNLDPAKLEYESLITLYNNVFSTFKEYAVAKPIDYFSEDNAYLQKSVGDNNLRSYLLKHNSIFISGHSLNKLIQLLTESGKWLSIFHKETLSNEQVLFSPEKYINAIQGEFDYREFKQFAFRKDTLEKLDKLVNEITNLSMQIKIPCAKWHWDYTPGHVYIDHGYISVIDILGKDNVPIYEDIGHFVASLTCINNLPFHILFSHKRARGQLCDAFLAGYLDGAGLDDDEVRLFINLSIIKYLVVYFMDQYRKISDKAGNYVGRLFANYRLVKLTQDSLILATTDALQYLERIKQKH